MRGNSHVRCEVGEKVEIISQILTYHYTEPATLTMQFRKVDIHTRMQGHFLQSNQLKMVIDVHHGEVRKQYLIIGAMVIQIMFRML